MSWPTFIGNNPVQLVVSAAPPSFQVSAPSGGGYIRGIDIHTDGTMIARGDVFPLFISTTTLSNTWTPIFTPASVSPANTLGFSNGITGTGGTWNQGKDSIGFSVWEAKIAPTSSSIIYVYYQGNVYVSTNKGATFAITSGPGNTWPSDETNDSGGNQFGPKMAVDPNNSNCVVAGSPSQGFFVTTNAGGTWTRPTGTPTSTSAVSGNNIGVTGIVFDPTSGTTGGLTNTVYACVWGSGVWQTTTTVTGTWSLLASSPTGCLSAICLGGVYYVAGTTAALTNTTLQKFSGGTWSTVTTDTNGINCICSNPNNATNIVYIDSNGRFAGQMNGAVHNTFSGWATTAGDCPALQLQPASGSFYSPSQCLPDPGVSQRFWFCCGIGVFYTDSITSASFTGTVSVAPRTHGINAMVTYEVAKLANGPLLWAGQDRQAWSIASPTVEPSTFGVVANQSNIFPAWAMDWAKDNSGTIIAHVGTGQGTSPDNSMFSTNSGASWALMSTRGTVPTWNSGGGGTVHMAASTSNNWCALANTGTGVIYFTTNGGTTWSTATGTPTTGTPSAHGNRAKVIAADLVTANTFYLASTGNGLYTSTNSGSTWSLVASLPTTLANWQDQLLAAPSNAGHLWLCTVNGSTTGSATHPQTTQLSYRSVNGGSTWTSLSNICDLWCMGFGQPAPGFSYPTIWIVGWVKPGGVGAFKYGVWVSKDAASTWTWLTDYPAGSFGNPVRIVGDPGDWTKCYVGINSSTIVYGFNLSY